MKLSYRVIVECLEQIVTVLETGRDSDSLYGLPSVLETTQEIEAERIYITSADNFDYRLIENNVLLIICCGQTATLPTSVKTVRHPKAKCQVVIIALAFSEASWLCGKICDLFDREATWQESLWALSLKAGGSPILDYLKASADMFDGALMYFPLGGYRSCLWVTPQGRESAKPEGLISDDEKSYAEEAQIEALGSAVGLSEPIVTKIIDKYGDDMILLAASVRESGGRYIGMFLTQLESEQATEAQLHHIRQLRDYWETALSLWPSSDSEERLTSYKLLEMLLTGEYFDAGEMKRLLKAMGFFNGSTYVCISINFINLGPYENIPLETHLSTIDSMANGVFSVKKSSSSAHVLYDTSVNEESITCFLSRIAEYIKPIEREAGVSHPFTNIMEASAYAQQADIALKMGKINNPEKSTHMFSDVAVQYILEHGTEKLPAHMLCAPGLLALHEKSVSGTIDYTQTLYTYLRCFGNVSAAAKELNVHRSTFLYRLDHISKITQMDLYDPKDRLYLEVSLILLLQD